ncbi:MAG: glycerophosphodiester phosphodiesterase [Anaeromyxobacter sp.]
MRPAAMARSSSDETLPAPAAAGRPLVLGHRGASGEAPENTLAAFRLALAQGADGVELDVWRCATGEVVVIHDEDARRTAGAPMSVPGSPLAALRTLDVGAWKGAAWRGERIPLLAEVLEALPGAVVNVELKSRGRDPGLASAAAAVIRDARAGERVIVSSFDFRLLAAFRAAAPELPLGLLFDDSRSWRLRVALGLRWLRPAAVHPDRRLVTPARAQAWRARGLAMNVWTVDDGPELERLCALKAGAVIANDPAAARAAVRRATGR